MPPPSLISDALTQVIADFDRSIGDALLRIFPDNLALMDMDDDDVKNIINDDGPVSAAVLHCMRGSTALISLTDPSISNLWVASLGDSAASKLGNLKFFFCSVINFFFQLLVQKTKNLESGTRTF